MDLRAFGPDDLAAVRAFVEIDNARVADVPWMHPETVYRRQMTMRHGWDGDVRRHYLAYDEGRPVGYLVVDASTWDNPDLAWLEIVVHPDHRRRGHGTAILAAAQESARAMGRTLLGVDDFESDGLRGFAAAQRWEQKSQSVHRRQHLAELPDGLVDGLYDEAVAHAGDYAVLRVTGASPDDLLEELSEVGAAINDAPLDDLELEDENYAPERMRAYERAMLASGYRLYRVMARHGGTGALAGHTVVVVDSETPAIGEQHDTAVLAAHRGHRLGLLLKTDLLRWLTGPDGVEPALATIDTWNAESNDAMVGINERLGYRVMGRELQFQWRI